MNQYAFSYSPMAHSRRTPTVPSIHGSTATDSQSSQHYHRSRSLSPDESTHHIPKGYAVVSATQCDVFISPTPSKCVSRSMSSTYSTTPTVTRYTSPFISTKARPSLYQRAISDPDGASSGGRGRSRSRSTAGSPTSSASTPVLARPSFAGAMIPPCAIVPHASAHQRRGERQKERQIERPNERQIERQSERQNDDDIRRDSDVSSRCSSRASTNHSGSVTASNLSGNGKRGFVAKLKSVLKGDSEPSETINYLLPEAARERDTRIKKAVTA